MSTGEDRWQPDEGLIYAVQHRPVPIADLSGPDRAWIVAYLAAAGWTVASIAERLRCSLRLVQQIKAEPMTQVAAQYHVLRGMLGAQSSLQRIERVALERDLADAQSRVSALERQRDILLARLTEGPHHVPIAYLPDLLRLAGTPPGGEGIPRPLRLGHCG